MGEQELQEFSLEDIIKEFSDTPGPEPLEVPGEEEMPELEEPAEELAEGMPEEPAQPAVKESVTADTIRMEAVHFGKGQVHNAQPVEEEPQQPHESVEEEDPFTEGWEPDYEQPIAEYVPPRPVLIHPRSRLRELKGKLVAGPEKLYYTLAEKGLGKLQAAIFFSILVVVISAIATALEAFGQVSESRMKLLVFGQFMAMLISALLGSFQMLEGVEDLLRKRFSLNTLLVFSFVLCCADGIVCLYELPRVQDPRVPCCAAFSLQMLMSLWQAYEKRSATMGQMDTMRKATHLDGIAAVPEFYEDSDGLLRTEGQVEDFMEQYDKPSRLQKILSLYALAVTGLSVAIGITAGVLHGFSMGIQVAAVTTLAAVPSSMFVTLSRPFAVLERRLHSLGAVLCGWQGVEGLNRKMVFPLDHEDLCPTGAVKLNGVKFYGDRDSDEVIAYCAALCNMDGGALAPVFEHLRESRNGIHYGVSAFRAYDNGGIGGEVNTEPVLVGTLPFLKAMGVEVPEGIRVNNAVGISVDGDLCGLFAITYEKIHSSAAGLATLTGYRNLKPILISDDFMMTDTFIREKFNINPKRILFPDRGQRARLREKKPGEGSPTLAISTATGFAPFAYCVTGARALKNASTVGAIVHMIGGVVGIGMMLTLAILGAAGLLTPANIFLYQIVWSVPGLLITEWTRSI